MARDAAWFIIGLAGQAPHRRSRVTSNVRRHYTHHYGAPEAAASLKMNLQRVKSTNRATFAAGALFGPPNAVASGGSVFEGLLLPLIAVGVLFWIAYFAYTPLRRGIANVPRRLNSVWALVLGAAVLGYAGVSALIGKTTLGGRVIDAVHEPIWFWNLIKLQVGAGCVLLVLGLVGRGRSK